MPIADKRYAESSARSRLLELVRQTKRYSICEIKTDQFEVIDDLVPTNRLMPVRACGRPEVTRGPRAQGLQRLIEFDLDESLSSPKLRELQERLSR